MNTLKLFELLCEHGLQILWRKLNKTKINTGSFPKTPININLKDIINNGKKES